MSFESPEWWGFHQVQGPGVLMDKVGGGVVPTRGRFDVLDAVPWADGDSWEVLGISADEYGSQLADVHPYVVLARRRSTRADGWELQDSAPNPDTIHDPVVFEWTPDPDFSSRYTDAPQLQPLDGNDWSLPLTWRGIDGAGDERVITPEDGLWLVVAPIPASEWSGGTLRVADGKTGAHTLVRFVPHTPDVDPFAAVLGRYELVLDDDNGFSWVVWLTHFDAVVSDGTAQPIVRDTSPFRRDIRTNGFTRTAQVDAGETFGNAIQLGNHPDARVYAVSVDPSLNFRGRSFTMEARVSRRVPSLPPDQPLSVYKDCCLFYFGSWSFVIAPSGSLAVRLGSNVRPESGAQTVLETATGLIDLTTAGMAQRMIALTRNDAGLCTIWLDGQPVGSSEFNPPSSTEAGLSGPGNREGLAAFTRFDEVRWTNGLCRYTEPYTPDVEPFPDGGGDVFAPPGAVVDLALADATAHTLTATWGPPLSGGEALGYIIEWAPAGTGFDEALSITVTTTSATVADLAFSTRYDLRVYAVNTAGPGRTVTLLDVSTTARALPAAPQELTVDRVSATDVTVSWLGPDEMGDAELQSYVVEYADAGTGFAQPRSGTAVGDSGGGAGIADGLTSASAYDLRAAAATEAGRGAWALALGIATLAHPMAAALLVDMKPLVVERLSLVMKGLRRSVAPRKRRTRETNA
ncbi:fibronectin type III domain-containing protein [Ideonella sp.]|uniref:fibronectin type III domain-containing protein n=1 Tax=Ideonella sp. TaxID=1929293 RepID=UPI0035B1AC92